MYIATALANRELQLPISQGCRPIDRRQ